MSRTWAVARARGAAQDPELEAELGYAIDRVMSSGMFVLGPELEAFETEFAAFCGSAHCVGTGSGTEALRLALTAAGVGAGDEVVTVSHTVAATVFAIELAGATPVLVDIDPRTYTMDVERAEEAIVTTTRAILPVHLYGHCANMADILDLARRRGLIVIEDAAQAHGAFSGVSRAGTLGTAGCFSFYPTKNLGGCGDGGAVVTDDAALAERLRLLRDSGRGASGRHELVAGHSRLDELQAAILRVKLAHLDAGNAARRRHAAVYAELLAGLPLTLPEPAEHGEHVFHLFVVRTPERDALFAHLEAHDIETGVHPRRPVHLQPAYARGVAHGDLTVTEAYADAVVSLPMYPELAVDDVVHVAQVVRDYFERSDRRRV